MGGVHKKNYFQTFWKRRIPTIIVPAIVVQIIKIVLHFAIKNEQESLTYYLLIDRWVITLFELYFVFWGVHSIINRSKKINSEKKDQLADVLTCFVILCMSLVTELTSFKLFFTWAFQSLGFIYGILFYRFYPVIDKIVDKHYFKLLSASIIFAGVFGVLYVKYRNIYFWGDYVIHAVFHLCIVLVIVILMRRISFGNAIATFLGKNSYEVYLIHRTIVTSLLLYRCVAMSSGTYIWVTIICTLALSVVINKMDGFLIRKITKNRIY